VYHIERLDPGLAALVSADAPITKVGAMPVALTRFFGVAGDIGLRGLAHIRAAIKAEMAADQPDIVMITGSPYYPMLLTGWIERCWRVPVVLDFQDPWVTPVGATAKAGSKSWLAHQLAVRFEPKAVKHAAFITSVSDQQNEELADRCPLLDRSRMTGIPIGGDPEDFMALGLDTISEHTVDQEKRTIVYTGTVWPGVLPILDKFLSGLELASKSLVDHQGFTQCLFMGTTANPNGNSEYRVRPRVAQLSVSSIVKEIPERRPYLDAVQVMRSASVNLILGSTEPHYTASKIYPILMANKPHLSILHRKSSSHDILSKAGGGIALAFETPDELEALPSRIEEALMTLATNPESVGHVNPAAYANYTAHAVAGRFAAIFDQLNEERRSGKLRVGVA
jgi:glycosyltransferase involved in cell wall biosynthesis